MERAIKESVAIGELAKNTDVRVEVQSLIAFVDGLGVQHLMSSRGMSAKRLLTLLDRYLTKLYSTAR